MSEITCPRCGTSLTPGTKFCSECGNDVTTAGGGGSTKLSTVDIEATLLEYLKQATRGEFEIARELGRGGMAMVYLAKDIALNRDVAIKVMSPSLGADLSMAERFVREAQTSASLSHPNIIPVYTVRQTANITFFVMKYIQGRPLDDIMDEVGAIPVPLATAILSQVAGALGYGHKRGVVHRDVKPGNVMIDDEGWAVVTDFGIAKVEQAEGLTQTGAAIGTPTYMSPEQCTAKPVTGASDQYSLGVVAYEMLTGSKPFDGDSVMSIMYAHVNEPPPPFLDSRPDCPPHVHEAVMRMLSKKPEDRFERMEDVVAALGTPTMSSDDPVRTEMITLAASGVSSKLIDNVRTPRSPMPLDSITPSSVQPKAGTGVRPSAPTVQTPGGSTAVDSGPQVSSGQQAAQQSKSRKGMYAAVTAIAVVGVAGALWMGPFSQGGDDTQDTPSGNAEQVQPPATSLVPASIQIEAPVTSVLEQDEITMTALVFDSAGTMLDGISPEWTSDDPRIASVSNGLVIGQREGTTRIVATAGDQTAAVQVTVTARRPSDQPPARVASIALSRSSEVLTVGGQAQIDATPRSASGQSLSGRSLNYRSSSPSVATVDASGLVRGVGPGSATIEIGRDDARASVQVTVSPVAVASVTLTPGSATLEVGRTQTLAAELRDAGGNTLSGRTVEWTTSNPSVATVSNGTVTATGAGTASITARSGNATGVTSVTVNAPVVQPTGPTPDESRDAIRGLIEAYRVAFERRDIAALQRAYPGMTAEQQNSWNSFFGGLSRLAVTFQPPQITLGEGTAEASVATRWDYRADRDRDREFVQVFQFQYRGSAWVMTGWRSN